LAGLHVCLKLLYSDPLGLVLAALLYPLISMRVGVLGSLQEVKMSLLWVSRAVPGTCLFLRSRFHLPFVQGRRSSLVSPHPRSDPLWAPPSLVAIIMCNLYLQTVKIMAGF
jgi:hypothetical protein